MWKCLLFSSVLVKKFRILTKKKKHCLCILWHKKWENNTKQSKTAMPLDTLSDNHILNVLVVFKLFCLWTFVTHSPVHGKQLEHFRMELAHKHLTQTNIEKVGESEAKHCIRAFGICHLGTYRWNIYWIRINSKCTMKWKSFALAKEIFSSLHQL